MTDTDSVTVNLTADLTFPMAAGTTVTWTATATGGPPPYQYEFWLYDQSIGWRIAQTYSTDNTFSWRPSHAGTFEVQVWVLGAGSTNDWDGYRGTPFLSVTPPPPMQMECTTTTQFPVQAGTPITWKMSAAGGVKPRQRRVYVNDPEFGWVLLQDYDSLTDTITWTPWHQGSYGFQAWVRSAGSTAQYDTICGTLPMSIGAPTTRTVISLTSNVLLPAAPGTPITWTAVATAAAHEPLEYRFILYRASTGVWTEEQAYGPSDTWTWTPTEADTYAMQVWVRAQGSGAGYEAYKSSGYFTIGTGPVQNLSLTRNQTLPTTSDVPITWTAKASGGTAPLEYRFVMLDVTTGTWTAAQEWSPANTYTWTPTRAEFGQHVLQVWVRSTGSSAEYEAWASTGYFLIQP